MVVGGHGYDVPGFKALFDSLDGVDWYLQDIDNWAGSPVADQYDVFVFYHVVAWGVWSLRPDMQERIDTVNRQIGTTGQGWFVWHHALLSFPESPAFDRVCNSTDRTLKKPGRFTPRIDMNVHVEDPDHPVTAGVDAFAISGEGFLLPACGPESTRAADPRPRRQHPVAGVVPRAGPLARAVLAIRTRRHRMDQPQLQAHLPAGHGMAGRPPVICSNAILGGA